MRKYWSVVGLWVVTMLAAPLALAQEKPAKAEAEKKEPAAKLPLCPVMEEPVDFAVKTMTADGPVYFCCKDCIPKYEAAPQKFAEKVAAQRAACEKLPRIQVNCPLDGKPIKADASAEIDGQTLYFCCNDCAGKYKESPAKYKAGLLGSYTYQTKCPVTSERIMPVAFVDQPDGNRVYYCCVSCDKQVRKDPAKYAAKLKEQGTHLNLKKFKGDAAADKPGAEKGKPADKHEHKPGEKHDHKH
jgi:YHS domain-containing protein